MTSIQIYIIWKDKCHKEYVKGLRNFKRGKGYNCLKGLEKRFHEGGREKVKSGQASRGCYLTKIINSTGKGQRLVGYV